MGTLSLLDQNNISCPKSTRHNGRRRRIRRGCRLPRSPRSINSSSSSPRPTTHTSKNPTTYPSTTRPRPSNHKHLRRSKSRTANSPSNSLPNNRVFNPRLPSPERQSNPHEPPLLRMGILRHPRRLRPRRHNLRTLPLPQIPPPPPRIRLQPHQRPTRKIQPPCPSHPRRYRKPRRKSKRAVENELGQ